MEREEGQWFALEARSREAWFGFGHIAEALRFCEVLDGDNEYDLYIPREMTSTEIAERDVDGPFTGPNVCNLADALTDMPT